ncbi:MAG: hypothetical protein FJ187_08915 [Gammaproteobacteria bacterium]|nr:hypothetical protein [Gammaproteobacteria bacterium]
MQSLKISFLWVYDNESVQNSVLFNLFKQLSKNKIEIVDYDKADIIFIGPYDSLSFKRRLFSYFSKKKYFNLLNKFYPNIDIYSFKRSYKPLKIYLSRENYTSYMPRSMPDYDFSFYHNLGIVGDNHFRFPIWKEHIDWSHEGIIRDIESHAEAKRLGFFLNLESLLRPQGFDFMRKKKEVCFVTSYLLEPKKSIYLKFKNHFNVVGYGMYFDPTIAANHKSNFLTSDVLKNYAFYLCPENSVYPGYYSARVADGFLSKSLPITWADKSINIDFNPKAFINLIDDIENNYENICNSLKDDSFLKKFTYELLILKRIDLTAERISVEKILSNFQ